MVTAHLINLFVRLQNAAQRKDAAEELARHLGVESALLFGKDAEIDVFLPAPAFPQTLRQGGKWQLFLERCAANGEYKSTLPHPNSQREVAVFGIADEAGHCVLAFIGDKPAQKRLVEVKALLPLLGAKLVDERAALAAAGHAKAAREANRKAGALNDALDLNRHELYAAIERAERELSHRRQAEEELRVADRRKNEFLAMLAHELRNPLGTISVAVEMMGLANTPSVLEKARHMIERQTKHLTHIINDLLDVSRITQGKVSLQRERLDLRSVLSSALEMVQPFLESRGHALHVELPARAIWLHGDLVRLSQIMVNLLHNAGKYTPPNGKVTLTARREEGMALITICDNGIGIAPEALPRIFDVFWQADYARERVQDGLGIGLSLVHRLVELHGGTIRAASDGPGQGSLFELRLPALVEDYSTAAPAGAGAESAVSSAKRRILVADDNHDSADMIALFFSGEGHEVKAAYDGASAIEQARNFLPEFIFLDITMPDMSGYDVARVLRKLPAFDDTIIVAVTGLDQEHNRRLATEAGFNSYITKPASFEKLKKALLEGRPSAAPTGAGTS